MPSFSALVQLIVGGTFALSGALYYVKKSQRRAKHDPKDIPSQALVALGMSPTHRLREHAVKLMVYKSTREATLDQLIDFFIEESTRGDITEQTRRHLKALLFLCENGLGSFTEAQLERFIATLCDVYRRAVSVIQSSQSELSHDTTSAVHDTLLLASTCFLACCDRIDVGEKLRGAPAQAIAIVFLNKQREFRAGQVAAALQLVHIIVTTTDNGCEWAMQLNLIPRTLFLSLELTSLPSLQALCLHNLIAIGHANSDYLHQMHEIIQHFPDYPILLVQWLTSQDKSIQYWSLGLLCDLVQNPNFTDRVRSAPRVFQCFLVALNAFEASVQRVVLQVLGTLANNSTSFKQGMMLSPLCDRIVQCLSSSHHDVSAWAIVIVHDLALLGNDACAKLLGIKGLMHGLNVTLQRDEVACRYVAETLGLLTASNATHEQCLSVGIMDVLSTLSQHLTNEAPQTWFSAILMNLSFSVNAKRAMLSRELHVPLSQIILDGPQQGANLAVRTLVGIVTSFPEASAALNTPLVDTLMDRLVSDVDKRSDILALLSVVVRFHGWKMVVLHHNQGVELILSFIWRAVSLEPLPSSETASLVTQCVSAAKVLSIISQYPPAHRMMVKRGADRVLSVLLCSLIRRLLTIRQRVMQLQQHNMQAIPDSPHQHAQEDEHQQHPHQHQYQKGVGTSAARIKRGAASAAHLVDGATDDFSTPQFAERSALRQQPKAPRKMEATTTFMQHHESAAGMESPSEPSPLPSEPHTHLRIGESTSAPTAHFQSMLDISGVNCLHHDDDQESSQEDVQLDGGSDELCAAASACDPSDGSPQRSHAGFDSGSPDGSILRRARVDAVQHDGANDSDEDESSDDELSRDSPSFLWPQASQDATFNPNATQPITRHELEQADDRTHPLSPFSSQPDMPTSTVSVAVRTPPRPSSSDAGIPVFGLNDTPPPSQSTPKRSISARLPSEAAQIEDSHFPNVEDADLPLDTTNWHEHSAILAEDDDDLDMASHQTVRQLAQGAVAVSSLPSTPVRFAFRRDPSVSTSTPPRPHTSIGLNHSLDSHMWRQHRHRSAHLRRHRVNSFDQGLDVIRLGDTMDRFNLRRTTATPTVHASRLDFMRQSTIPPSGPVRAVSVEHQVGRRRPIPLSFQRRANSTAFDSRPNLSTESAGPSSAGSVFRPAFDAALQAASGSRQSPGNATASPSDYSDQEDPELAGRAVRFSSSFGASSAATRAPRPRPRVAFAPIQHDTSDPEAIPGSPLRLSARTSEELLSVDSPPQPPRSEPVTPHLHSLQSRFEERGSSQEITAPSHLMTGSMVFNLARPRDETEMMTLMTQASIGDLTELTRAEEGDETNDQDDEEVDAFPFWHESGNSQSVGEMTTDPNDSLNADPLHSSDELDHLDKSQAIQLSLLEMDMTESDHELSILEASIVEHLQDSVGLDMSYVSLHEETVDQDESLEDIEGYARVLHELRDYTLVALGHLTRNPTVSSAASRTTAASIAWTAQLTCSTSPLLNFHVEDMLLRQILLCDWSLPAGLPGLSRAFSTAEASISIDHQMARCDSWTFDTVVGRSAAHGNGVWAYGVVISSTAVTQIGWSTREGFDEFHPTNGFGCGDSEHSYAYDGSRQQAWHGCFRGHTYGQKWTAGDVVLAVVDLEKRQMSFWLNGVDLGVAFHNINAGPWYPCVSISNTQQIRFDWHPTNIPNRRQWSESQVVLPEQPSTGYGRSLPSISDWQSIPRALTKPRFKLNDISMYFEVQSFTSLPCTVGLRDIRSGQLYACVTICQDMSLMLGGPPTLDGSSESERTPTVTTSPFTEDHVHEDVRLSVSREMRQPLLNASAGDAGVAGVGAGGYDHDDDNVQPTPRAPSHPVHIPIIGCCVLNNEAVVVTVNGVVLGTAPLGGMDTSYFPAVSSPARVNFGQYPFAFAEANLVALRINTIRSLMQRAVVSLNMPTPK
eukprot:m.79518 g.79518  ORF g.79518 m.79518 type:complete len:1946 (-) comp12571_c0_seq1:272-6109(-)